MERLHIASCSFGKDSIAAIITHIQHGGTVDEAVYCKIMFDNTLSAELPEHEEWIYDVAIPKLEHDWGVRTVIVQAEKSYKDQFYQKYKRGQWAEMIYGFPILIGPWCNSRLKVRPLDKYEKEQGGFIEIIGLTVDEPNRMPSKRNNPNVLLPLVEHGITQAQSFEICRKHGLLSPAYKDGIKRLGCWFCHNQRIGELRKLRKNYPDLWAILLELDKDSPCSFTPRVTVHDLEDRFATEDMQVSLFC